MNLAYGYSLTYVYDSSIATLNKYYQIVEDSSFIFDTSYILYLSNNQYRKVLITSNKPFSNLEKNQELYFHVDDVVTFFVKLNKKFIYYKLHKKGSVKLLKYWLIHTFLPILFTIEDKYYFIHAGSVEIDNKPVLFIANSYGGKSTLTDFFIKKNHTMISDDKVATYIKDNKIFCIPSYPYHRPYRKVEDLGIKVENFGKDNKPISKIYNLVKSDSSAKIEIYEIKGIDKFKALRHATDIDLFVNKESRFNMLSFIANNIKVYNITLPWDLNRLNEVYKSIILHCKK